MCKRKPCNMYTGLYYPVIVYMRSMYFSVLVLVSKYGGGGGGGGGWRGQLRLGDRDTFN